MKLNKEEQEAIDKVSPLCTACKHCRNPEYGSATCRKAILGAEPIDGIITYNPCYKERDEPQGRLDSRCGPKGKHFEPELTFFQKVLEFLGVTNG